MKRVLLVLLVYLLAMIQLGAQAIFPDLLLLVVVTAAVFEERSFALVLGALAGLFLDCGAPELVGTNMGSYLLIAFGVTHVRRLVHERVSYLVVICLLALVLKAALVLILARVLPRWESLLGSGALTLGLVVPVYRLIKSLFRYQWKVA